MRITRRIEENRKYEEEQQRIKENLKNRTKKTQDPATRDIEPRLI